MLLFLRESYSLYFLFLSLPLAKICLMNTHTNYTHSDFQARNHSHLEEVLNELAIWRYRVQSTLLVASSALLALSLSPLPPEVDKCCTLLWLYRSGLACNVLQLLASLVVLGMTLKHRIDIANRASLELLNPYPVEKAVVSSIAKCENTLYLSLEFSSFAFFVATVLILALCRYAVLPF